MADRETAYIGLGSNRGDRYRNLQKGVQMLDRHDLVDVERTSPIYASKAHVRGAEDSTAPFLNAVVEVRTGLSPRNLLDVCQEIEARAGRLWDPSDVWRARILDLDVLVFGRRTEQSDRLVLPHPEMGRRRFVLQPLVDVNPDCWIPEPFAATAEELLEQCSDTHPLNRTHLQLRVSE